MQEHSAGEMGLGPKGEPGNIDIPGRRGEPGRAGIPGAPGRPGRYNDNKEMNQLAAGA